MYAWHSSHSKTYINQSSLFQNDNEGFSNYRILKGWEYCIQTLLCGGGRKTRLATQAVFVKTRLLTGRHQKAIFWESRSVVTDCWVWGTRSEGLPLLSVLQPQTEVRSQVNIPPSRCLQHASGRGKTRPATPPYLQMPLALPILAPEPLQTVSRVQLSGPIPWHISTRWKTIIS